MNTDKGCWASAFACVDVMSQNGLILTVFSFTFQVEKLGKDSLVNSAKTSMSSKLIGGDSDFFANLVLPILSCFLQQATDEVTSYSVEFVLH